jgi:hypothetical protein
VGLNAVALSLLLSPEHAQQLVEQYYASFLGRSADSGELTSFANAISQGTPPELIVGQIAASDEFFAVAMAPTGTRARDQAFVALLYTDILGRAADANGPNFYTNQIGPGGNHRTTRRHAGRYEDALCRPIDALGQSNYCLQLALGVSRTAIALSVLNSTEHRQDVVDSYFEQLLNRPAASAELAFYTGQLQNGFPNEVVLAAIAGPDEYLAKAIVLAG